MDDRELLELAAKANWQQDIANDEVSLRYDEHEDGILYIHADNQDHNGSDREFRWNPLLDDGDALRLAVKLGMEIRIDKGASMSAANTELWADEGYCEGHANDPCEATRRAIVRAAAELATKEAK